MRTNRFASRGFTLLEVLVATTIFAVLVGSVYTLFYGTLRLREKTSEIVETRVPRDFIVMLIKRDLANMVPPVGLLAGPLIGENDEQRGQRFDRLEFHSSSGIVNDSEPWGEIQKIEYYLAEPEEVNSSEGNELVRAVTRNLLAATAEEPEDERLLDGVQSLEFAYYDAEYWQDVWDSTTQDNEMPLAVMMRLEFVEPEGNGRRMRPIEMVCEIVSQPIETEEQPEDEESAGPGTGPREQE